MKKMVALIVTCAHCGEPVEIAVSKKQIKEILKGFKLSLREATAQTEVKVFGKGERKG